MKHTLVEDVNFSTKKSLKITGYVLSNKKGNTRI